MFNKARFNQTLFSRVMTSGLSGGDARAITIGTGTLRVIRRFSSEAHAISNQISALDRVWRFSQGIANAVSNIGLSQFVRVRYFDGEANAISASSGGRVMSVIVYTFSMPELQLQSGDILQIDTGEYTVTLNGMNAVWMVTDLSEFFKLEPGSGTVRIEFENGGEADIRILWKERYL